MTTTSQHLLRPEPHSGTGAVAVDAHTPLDTAVEQLRSGTRLLVTDHYTTAQAIDDALRSSLSPPAASAPFAERQAHRRSHAEHAQRLLVPIKHHAVAVRGVRPIGFLEELYPDQHSFCVPFADLQALAQAWRRYESGIMLPVLGHRLHPYYGVYAPTRQEHLTLFATWLHQYAGPRDVAVDVGTGCGVLAFLLSRAGFSHVRATDINPNAIEGVRRDSLRHTLPTPLDLHCTDLLGPSKARPDLVVFNPPWIPGAVDSALERALNFDADLFPRFFAQARAQLQPGGRVVVVFSNTMRLLRPDVPHPIEAELEQQHFALIQRLQRRIRPPRKSGRRTKERVEVWELARR